jgi:hypothetical protein
MPKFQVIIRGKDHEPESYDIKADNFDGGKEAGQDVYRFWLDKKIIAWFPTSQIVGIIDMDSQEHEQRE